MTVPREFYRRSPVSGSLSIKPSVLNGEIVIPGSKSHTIRALIIAGLAEGDSVIRGPLFADDTISCIKALEKLGVSFSGEDGKPHILNVRGTGGKFGKPLSVINVGNSGTSLRILTAVGALSGHTISFDGDDSLRERPMQPLLSALYDLGVDVKSRNGHAPISVTGPLNGGETMVDGISSQFLTALLIACPLANSDTRIDIVDLHEKPYVEMTMYWLDKQNIRYTNKNFKKILIRGKQSYTPFTIDIPGDFSSATFPIVAAAVTGGRIKIKGLDMKDTQGDKQVIGIMEKMGTAITHESDGIVAAGGPLNGMALDLNNIPDSLPALAVAGCAAQGETRLLNVEQARLKESDRIRAIFTELKKMGAEIEELDHGLIIHKSNLKGTVVNGYNDHRIVMALSLAGLIASGETTINNGADAVRITYPSFIEDFIKLGATFKVLNK